MSKLSRLFKDSRQTPNQNLGDSIWSTILIKEARISKIRSIKYVSLGAFSLVGSILAIKDLLLQFKESGFSEYLSLAFSESGAVASYWKEFALSLADSLPTTSLIMSMMLVVMLFISLRKIAYQFSNKLSVA